MRNFTQISFYSKEFQKFLNMAPNISINPFDDKMTSGKIDFEFDNVNMKNEFKVSGLTYLISPTYSLIWKGPEFDFTPGLSLKLQGLSNEKQILRLSEVMLHFIQYCFMRTNIYPEEINILTRNIKGSLHFCIGNIKREKADRCVAMAFYLQSFRQYYFIDLSRRNPFVEFARGKDIEAVGWFGKHKQRCCRL